MNITIILPAVHVTSKRQHRDDSPQPTTPFPPISITPSPTPFSEIASSYNPDDYKDLIEEYNREISENHLSKSRADLVARQAAYDDIQITRSAPTTAGAGGGLRITSKTPSVSKSSGSEPCPYCSSTSESKSEPSLRSIQVERFKEIVSATSASPTALDSERRGPTETSLSTDRATESPSSVDTVNTVIQSNAYNILGELRGNDNTRETTPVLNDSLENIGQLQNDDLYEPIEEKCEEILTQVVNRTSLSPAKFDCLSGNEFPEKERNLEYLYEQEEEEEQENEPHSPLPENTNYSWNPPSRKGTPIDRQPIEKHSPRQSPQPQGSPKSGKSTPLERQANLSGKSTPTDRHSIHSGKSTPSQGESSAHQRLQQVTNEHDFSEGDDEPDEIVAVVLADEDGNEECEEPVTSETGNDEVTIIVTQDEMPPANISSDEEAQQTGGKVSPEITSDTPAVEPQSTAEDLIQKSTESSEDTEEPETDSQPLPDPLYHTDSKSDFYEEEITKEIHEDSIKNSDSAYFDSHHEFNEESFFNSENVDNCPFEEQSEKGFDVSEQSYQASEKSYSYEKDFENESGYEDLERSFHENSQLDNHHPHDSNLYDPDKMHRQHTLADIPLLPMKKAFSVNKPNAEDFNPAAAAHFLRKRVKAYPDPRKPAVYPQRLNKTTLARQALAREKRRIYVEERIQNFMRNTKSIQTPYGSLDRSFSIEKSNKVLNTTSTSISYTSSKIPSDKKYDKLHNLPTTTMSSSSSRPNHDSLTQYRKSKIESPQSLPDISIIDYYMTPSRGLLTSTPVSSTGGKVPSRKSHLSSSMSSIRSPTIGIAEVSVLSGGGGTAPPSNKTTGGTTPRSGIVIDSIPEETSDFWKAISSEEGYFYTFRVRQTGPVQMVDKGVQTQTGPMNFSKEFYTSPLARKRPPPINNKSSTVTLPLIDDRDKILREIAETVQLRHDAELRRAELIQRANDLQTLIKEKRDKINRRHEFWHKKYIEESSMTRPLEAACNSLRAELNTVHRRLLAHLEGRDLPLRLRDGPSKKANYKIMAARLQHEIKELQQKAKAAKLRLESEIKLKEQAEREVRELRNDLAHKKVIMSLARSQIASLPAVHSRGYDPLGY